MEENNNPAWKGKLVLLAIIFMVIGAGFFAASTYLGYTDGFMTDGQCNDMIMNATNKLSNISVYSSIIAITSENTKLCETGNVTYFTVNDTKVYPFFEYQNTNISINSMPVNQYCLNLNQE